TASVGAVRLEPVPWNKLIGTHQRTVIAALLAMGIRIDRAEEIAQDTWARLIELHQAGNLVELSLPGLAVAQARFLALHNLRRAALERRHLAGGTDLEAVPAGTVTPEQRVLDDERAKTALAVVSTAPASAQRIFRLLYAEPGMSHAEVAQRLELSVQ